MTASMTADRHARFAALHRGLEPLILFNIWDAGSAKAVAGAGAKALATGSWSMAAAHGYADGEAIPLDLVVQIVTRITETTELPLTVDFESGYAAKPEDVAANVGRIIEAGAVGINFEDGLSSGQGMHALQRQTQCIAAIQQAARDRGTDLFINARTDLFLQEREASRHASLVDAAIMRGLAYAEAGADGFFVPGLIDPQLIAAVTTAVRLPVNVMLQAASPPLDELRACGVRRISHGPGSYIAAMAQLGEAARTALGK